MLPNRGGRSRQSGAILTGAAVAGPNDPAERPAGTNRRGSTMKIFARRPVLAALLSLAAVVACLSVAAPAEAYEVTSGSLTISGDPGPGLSLVENGRGCNTVTASFTVLDAVYGANGYVQTFDATFEQHCDGLDPAARGEVHIANPPPPPALTLDLAVAAAAAASTLNGNASVHGTATCNKPT